MTSECVLSKLLETPSTPPSGKQGNSKSDDDKVQRPKQLKPKAPAGAKKQGRKLRDQNIWFAQLAKIWLGFVTQFSQIFQSGCQIQLGTNPFIESPNTTSSRDGTTNSDSPTDEGDTDCGNGTTQSQTGTKSTGNESDDGRCISRTCVECNDSSDSTAKSFGNESDGFNPIRRCRCRTEVEPAVGCSGSEYPADNDYCPSAPICVSGSDSDDSEGHPTDTTKSETPKSITTARHEGLKIGLGRYSDGLSDDWFSPNAEPDLQEQLLARCPIERIRATARLFGVIPGWTLEDYNNSDFTNFDRYKGIWLNHAEEAETAYPAGCVHRYYDIGKGKWIITSESTSSNPHGQHTCSREWYFADTRRVAIFSKLKQHLPAFFKARKEARQEWEERFRWFVSYRGLAPTIDQSGSYGIHQPECDCPDRGPTIQEHADYQQIQAWYFNADARIVSGSGLEY